MKSAEYCTRMFHTEAVIQPTSLGVAAVRTIEIGQWTVGEVWDAVDGKLDATSAAKEMLKDLLGDPEDLLPQSIFQYQLQKTLPENARFAGQLAQLLESVESEFQTPIGGNDIIALNNSEESAGVDAAIIGGDSDGNGGIISGDNQNDVSEPKPILAVAPAPPWYFTGRNDLIENIVTEITAAQPFPMIALTGMGGIGKTVLAQQIAKNVTEKFPGGVFWGDELPVKGNPSIILKQWSRLCGQNLEKESEDDLPSKVRELLTARLSKSGSILVIIDDVRLDWVDKGINIIKTALPPGVPIIITTRQMQIVQASNAKIYCLDVLARAESCQLLNSLSRGKIIASTADKIAELCGDMPLALKLIANLAERRKTDWLLKRLQGAANRLDVLQLGDAHKKEQSVKISFEISYQSLAELYPDSACIFRYLAAFTQPAFVIFEHLVNAFAQLNKLSFSGNKSVVENALLHLVKWSLLSEGDGGAKQHFQMHTLLHEYAQSILVDAIEIDEAVNTHIKYCVTFVEANPQLDLQVHKKSIDEFEKSYGQLLQALKQIKARHIINGTGWESEPELAYQLFILVSAINHHWQWHSQFTDRVEWLQIAYGCAEALKDKNKQADFARRIGHVLVQQGKLDEALEWIKLGEDGLGD